MRPGTGIPAWIGTDVLAGCPPSTTYRTISVSLPVRAGSRRRSWLITAGVRCRRLLPTWRPDARPRVKVAAMVTLAEEFFLVAHDVSGKARIGSVVLGLGLGGALLMELSVAGRVAIADNQVWVTGPALLGDPLLDATLAKIANGPGTRRPRVWVTRLGRGSHEVVSGRLVEAGVLGLAQHRAAGIFPVRRVPEIDGSIRQEVMTRLHGAVVQGADPQPRTAALVSLALALACGMPAKLFPGSDRKQVERRMHQIAEGEWAGPAVNKSVGAINAAITAAIAAASSSSF